MPRTGKQDAEEMPAFISPMLAKLTALPREDSDWAFEVKWDGVRAIARSQPGQLRLFSRNGNEITSAYPELGGLAAALGPHEAILDGEIVAFDDRGRPSFQALQPRMHLRGERAIGQLAASAPVSYVLFDLLWLDGHSLTELPYEQRRRQLDSLDLNGERWHVPEFHRGNGAALLAATREQGLEGIVGKPLNSRYLPGRRSIWAKIKNSLRQELVIGGWTTGKGNRAERLGALHLGVQDDQGELRYAGKVGTGFDADELDRLDRLLGPLAQQHSPFSGRQPEKGAHFVKPELVCEVEFSEWTHAGTLRQASYKGLRDDKPAAAVVRERPVPGPAGPGAAEPVSPSPEMAIGTATRPEPAWLAARQEVRGGFDVEVEGRALRLTNLEKVLYPATGFTKLDLITHYTAVAPVLLPHLRDRPLTLKRYPNGVEAQHFYEKRSPAHRPGWVQTATVTSGRGQPDIPYTLCQDLPTLVWLANLADLELHPLLSLAPAIDCPTAMVFDLDPGAPADIVACCEVALELREFLAQLGLAAFAKTSGSKGIQVYVPLNDPGIRFEQTKPFAHAVARRLERNHPKLIVSKMAKEQRQGKVLIDWSQNDEHKTTICVYSLRATDQPRVSTPLRWSELESCRDHAQPGSLAFGPGQLLERISASGDLFVEILSLRQTLPSLED